MVIERIYFDPEFFASMLLKLEQFFFKHYAAYFKTQAVHVLYNSHRQYQDVLNNKL